MRVLHLHRDQTRHGATLHLFRSADYGREVVRTWACFPRKPARGGTHTRSAILNNPVNELLPCPFCGAAAYLEVGEPHSHALATFMPDSAGYVIVGCTKCSVMTMENGQDIKAGIDNWNKRAISDMQRAVIKKVRDLLADGTPGQFGNISVKDRNELMELTKGIINESPLGEELCETCGLHCPTNCPLDKEKPSEDADSVATDIVDQIDSDDYLGNIKMLAFSLENFAESYHAKKSIQQEKKSRCWDFMKQAMIHVSEDETKSHGARAMGKDFLSIMKSFEMDVERVKIKT